MVTKLEKGIHYVEKMKKIQKTKSHLNTLVSTDEGSRPTEDILNWVIVH